MRKVVWLLASLLLLAGELRAQAVANSAATVRYHYGDDADGKLGWAMPGFDDSAWPQAAQGTWPLPPFESDGFVWVRFRIEVSGDVAGPLAIRQMEPSKWPNVEELFVNGERVGKDGEFPPNVEVTLSRRTTVFDLPHGLIETANGTTAPRPTTAAVVLRAWYQPSRRSGQSAGSALLTIDDARTLHAQERGDRAVTRLVRTPLLVVDLFLAVLGGALFFLWRRSRSKEVFWCGVFLFFYAVLAIIESLPALIFLPVRPSSFLILILVLQIAQMWISLDFLEAIFNFHNRIWKWSGIACLLLFNLALIPPSLAAHPSMWLRGSLLVRWWAVLGFDGLTLAVDIWALFARRGKRAIAATLVLLPLASSIEESGFSRTLTAGPMSIDIFDLGFVLTSFGVSAMLIRQAWQARRASDELSAEFEAAREVQQQLITAPPEVAGYTIESVYAPAKQVGGDFFRLLPEEDGGLLIVMGDVSGKGLKAAMTVSSIIGALRSAGSSAPAGILQMLNRGLAGNLSGGFVTCCAARILQNGTMTIANAGQLSPYWNGEEMAVDAGLPLGIVAEVAYEEQTYALQPGDRLTFLSDGVVEAQSASGELFGFERTLALSAESAEQIAQAAQQFGQEDDITVLTIRRVAAAGPTHV